MRKFGVILFLMLMAEVTLGQAKKLQSVRHGLHMMLGDVSADTIISDVVFADGKDDSVDILRLDIRSSANGHVLPLIISSKEPLEVDSLGLIPVKFNKDSLERLIAFVKHYENKLHHSSYSESLVAIKNI